VLEAPTGRDIDTAFARLAQKPIDALLVGPGPLLDSRRVVVTLAAQVPAIFPLREFAEAGGLMSYGTSITDASHSCAADSTSVSSTLCRSKVERLMTLSTSDHSSRVSSAGPRDSYGPNGSR
jgi:hypothetical protein